MPVATRTSLGLPRVPGACLASILRRVMQPLAPLVPSEVTLRRARLVSARRVGTASTPLRAKQHDASLAKPAVTLWRPHDV